jgi:hypothetical protein
MEREGRTMQSKLFDDLDVAGGVFNPPAQRHSPTSVEAAKSVKERAQIARNKVYAALRHAGLDGLTDEELISVTGLSGNCARPRRIELVTAGMVRDSGRTRLTASRRRAVVWVAK